MAFAKVRSTAAWCSGGVRSEARAFVNAEANETSSEPIDAAFNPPDALMPTFRIDAEGQTVSKQATLLRRGVRWNGMVARGDA